MYEYGAEFYRLLASFAVRSAEGIVPKLSSVLTIRSVADFGCGQGAWLSVWAATGTMVTGVDGPYVNRSGLLINPADFIAADLAQPVDLGREFDLVQSLEVAEHLPAASAEGFIDMLAAHGSCVLFSAAVPGQGGEGHINEQPLDYWRNLFRERGYTAIDYLRPLIADDPRIERWYRYNILLYVRADRLGTLPLAIRSCRIPDDEPLIGYWPLPLRLRNAIVRRLPAHAVNRLARLKANRVARRGRSADQNAR